MKIALFVGSFSGGGAERVMISLAEMFCDAGYDVDFIVMNDKGPLKSSLDPRANKVILKKGENWSVGRVFAFWRLRKYMRSKSCDLMLSTIRDGNIFCSLVWLVSGKPFPLYLREAATMESIRKSKAWFKKLRPLLMRFLYPRVTGVIANSKDTLDDLKSIMPGLSGHQSIVIYNPLDISRFKNARYSLPPVDFDYIVAAGRLVQGKNFSSLIKAFKMYADMGGELNLVIIGSGPELANLKEEAKQLSVCDRVFFPGFVSSPECYFAHAKMFVQTSLYEGFGYVLVEAMASGAPVIVYDSKGPMREILLNGECGCLISTDDVASLACKIYETDTKGLGENNCEGALQRFEKNRIFGQYLNFMRMS